MAILNKINVSGTTYDINDERIGTGTDDNHLPIFEKICDADGNLRFDEGPLTDILTGITPAFAKWSLSGTHIMFVLAGTVDNNTEIADGAVLGKASLQTWIANKIYPIVGATIEYKSSTAYGSDYSTQDFNVRLAKNGTDIEIKKNGGITLTRDRNIRLQFDLLIDNE